MGRLKSWVIRGLILAVLAGIAAGGWIAHDWVSPEKVRAALVAALRDQFPDAEVRELLRRTGMPKHTDNTLTTPDAFTAQLHQAEANGYATDEGEQELGVRCVAVAVPDAPSHLAISISGPAGRMTEPLVEQAIPLLTQAAKALSEDLH